MIFLARGDTIASGQEWAAYFHRGYTYREVKSIPIAEKPHATAKSNQVIVPIKPTFDRQSLLLGTALLLIALLTLIILLVNRNRFDHITADHSPITNTDLSDPVFTTIYSPRNNHFPSASHRSTAPNHPLVENRPLYSNLLNSHIRINPSHRPLTKSPPPVEKILRKFQSGQSESEIARDLHLSIEEVAMVLSLERLAHIPKES